MLIKKKRIRKLGRYVRGFKRDDKIVVALTDVEHQRNKLKGIGFQALGPGEMVLPSPIGPVSAYNSEGKYIIHKDQPMETAYRQREWTWQEFRGRYDRVEQSGIVDVPYKRYPRTFVEPPAIELTFLTQTTGEPIVVSPKIAYTTANEQLMVHVINLFLELFGECELLDSSLNRIVTASIRRLNWDVLPPGRQPWEQLRPHLDPIIMKQPAGNQIVVHKRFEKVNSFGPEFVAVGRAGFDGYLVFGFPDKNLYVLESVHVNNATYVLENDWETLSTLSKAEILQNQLHKERVIHRKSWFRQIGQVLSN